jgi:hypothetical protein
MRDLTDEAIADMQRGVTGYVHEGPLHKAALEALNGTSPQ